MMIQTGLQEPCSVLGSHHAQSVRPSILRICICTETSCALSLHDKMASPYLPLTGEYPALLVHKSVPISRFCILPKEWYSWRAGFMRSRD